MSKTSNAPADGRAKFLELVRAGTRPMFAALVANVPFEDLAEPGLAAEVEVAERAAVAWLESVATEGGVQGSDALLKFTLAARDPNRFGNHQSISGPNGGPIPIAVDVRAQIAAKLDAMAARMIDITPDSPGQLVELPAARDREPERASGAVDALGGAPGRQIASRQLEALETRRDAAAGPSGGPAPAPNAPGARAHAPEGSDYDPAGVLDEAHKNLAWFPSTTRRGRFR